MMRNGFLAPNGEFIECRQYQHLETALKMVMQMHPVPCTNEVKAEQYLLNNGYVELTGDECIFYGFSSPMNEKGSMKPNYLTREQKNFLISEMERATPIQRKSIEGMLEDDEDLRNSNMLEVIYNHNNGIQT